MSKQFDPHDIKPRFFIKVMKQYCVFLFLLLLTNLASAQQNNDIRSVKSTISSLLFLEQSFWAKVLWGILFLVIIVFFIWKAIMKWLTDDSPVQNDGPQNPWDRAYHKLDLLADKRYPEKHEFKTFYSELSDILRVYMEERFEIHAPEMTSEEFLFYLNNMDVLNLHQKEHLKEFLVCCDMVKFAKFTVAEDEAKKGFLLVKKIVDDTKVIAISSESKINGI